MKFERTIRYRLTAEEVADGWLKYRRHATHWRVRIGLIIVGTLMTAYSTVCEKPLGIGFASAVAFTVIAVLLCALTPLQIRRHYLRAARNRPEHTESKEIAFGNDGLMITDAAGQVSFTWTKVKRITEDDWYFYLHANRSGWVMLLPRSAFDATAEETFRRSSQAVPRA